MKVSDVAKRTGVSVATVRYYEREGLLRPARRLGNGYRRFDERAVERIAFVRQCRAWDLPLYPIRRLLDYCEHPKAQCEEVTRLIRQHLGAIRQRIAELQSIEKRLVGLDGACDRGSAAHCAILHDLRDAAAASFKAHGAAVLS